MDTRKLSGAFNEYHSDEEFRGKAVEFADRVLLDVRWFVGWSGVVVRSGQVKMEWREGHGGEGGWSGFYAEWFVME